MPAAEPQTLPYGDLPDQVGDLLLPDDGGSPLSVAMLVHGGFWRDRYRRDTMTPLAEDLAARGWAVWNVEYRRVGSSGGWPVTAEDVLAALDALPGLSDRLAGAPITVVGHSAGGHLALWLAARRDMAGVVSLAGVTDLQAAEKDRLGSDAVREFLGGKQAADRPEADPARQLPTGVPSLLVHGDEDVNVPMDQSERYHGAATAAGDRCALLRLAGVDHFEIIDPTSEAWRRTLLHWPSSSQG